MMLQNMLLLTRSMCFVYLPVLSPLPRGCCSQPGIAIIRATPSITVALSGCVSMTFVLSANCCCGPVLSITQEVSVLGHLFIFSPTPMDVPWTSSCPVSLAINAVSLFYACSSCLRSSRNWRPLGEFWQRFPAK